MSKYSMPKLRKHWTANAESFLRREHGCVAFFRHLAFCGGVAVEALAGKRELGPNCAYLLLAKSLNHSFSAQILMERGLLVDAALSARNAIEALLLLELLVKKPELCQPWVSGKEFRPVDVRRQLEELPRVEVHDVVIETSPDEHGNVRFLYSYLSRITHANLESLDHVASQTALPDSFIVHIGGAHSPKFSKIIAASIGDVFSRTVPCALGAYATPTLQKHARDFELLRSKAHALVKLDASA